MSCGVEIILDKKTCPARPAVLDKYPSVPSPCIVEYSVRVDTKKSGTTVIPLALEM